ncbi:MAG: hypothetical protein MZV70_01310 [Desulfobacterales bacterium]|nr:hypothetical protein [Desulfobacterales bacterium]
MNAVFLFLVTRTIIPAVLVLGTVSSLTSAVVYDLVQKAPEAKWTRALIGAGRAPLERPRQRQPGFRPPPRPTSPSRTGRRFALVLETHPEWKTGGMIYGIYSNVQVPANAQVHPPWSDS